MGSGPIRRRQTRGNAALNPAYIDCALSLLLLILSLGPRLARAWRRFSR
jgi:hypothetical protein